jgi:cyclophilin family peptidyl-prolyl cis-trans isomerase
MAQLTKDFPNDFLFVYRNFPLTSIHDKAALATQAAEAANRQDKFWEMHDLLFNKSSVWGKLSVQQFESWLEDQAKTLGLDVDQFMADLKSPEMVQIAKDAVNTATKLKLTGTPFIILNDQIWNENLSLNYANLNAVIKLYILGDKQFTYCPPMAIDTSKTYIATLHTVKGDIVIELYPDKAPLAVNSFIFLAQNGWFNGVTFFSVTDDAALTGDPSGTGYGWPGDYFSNEINDLQFDKAGVVGMANGGENSNGSLFFITYGPVTYLNGRFTTFGQVTAGMDVAQKLTRRDPSTGGTNLPAGDAILSVDIKEK